MTSKKQQHPIAQSQKNKARQQHLNQKLILPALNPQNQIKKGNLNTYLKLIQHNQGYLQEKVKIKDIPKPSKYSHKIPSKTGTSEYNQRFNSIIKSFNLQDSTINRSIKDSSSKTPMQSINNYNSVYNNDYKDKQTKEHGINEAAKKVRKYQRLQGPTFIQSSYQRDYIQQKLGNSLETGKRDQSLNIGYGIYQTASTYNKDYKVRQLSLAPKLVIKQDHDFFTRINNPVKSSYKSQFLNLCQNRMQQQSFKPKNKLATALKKINFRTQYSDVYVNKPLTQLKEISCLSKEQLQRYVLQVLDKK